MTPRQRFMGVSIALSGLAVWLYLVTQVTANRNDPMLLGLFFVSLTVWVASAIAIGLFAYRVKKGNREVIFAHLKPAIRQGLIIAITFSCLLLLRMFELTSWWETLLIIIGAIIFEIALSGQAQKRGAK